MSTATRLKFRSRQNPTGTDLLRSDNLLVILTDSCRTQLISLKLLCVMRVKKSSTSIREDFEKFSPLFHLRED